jgi:hypothetical protein
MLVTSHALAGRIIGRLLPRRPLVAFAVGVVSHLVMDTCPHWSPEPGPGSHDAFLHVARRDGIAGLAAVAVSVATAPASERSAVVAGVAGAVLLDLDKPFLHFLGFNPFPRWVRRLHKAVQHEAPNRMPNELAAAAGLLATIVTGPGAWRPRQRLDSQIS